MKIKIFYIIFILVLSCSHDYKSRYLANDDDEYLTVHNMDKELLFGAEWTFGSDELLASFPRNGNEVQVQTEYSKEKIKSIKKRLDQNLEKTRARSERYSILQKNFHSHWNRLAYQVTYPDEFSFTFFSDPGIIEVNTSPSSHDFVKRKISRIKKDVFEVMASEDLRPSLFTGSGHLHIDVSKVRPLALRNFIVDFFNHTGIGSGGLNEDIFNAIGIGEIPDENKESLSKILTILDKDAEFEIDKFIDEITSKVYPIKYQKDLEEYRQFRRETRAGKYHGLSFNSYYSLGTIEIRSIRPQGSAESYQKLLELFLERMKFAEDLAQKGMKIKLGKLKSVRGDPQKVLRSFDEYVSGVGLDFSKYKEFVLPWWQQENGEFDKYWEVRPTPSLCRTNVKKFIKQ